MQTEWRVTTILTRCATCDTPLPDGVGRFNLPGGPFCGDCYDKPRKQAKTINIGGIDVPSKLLLEYASKVEMTRNAAQVGSRNNDPLVIMKALQERVVIHKKIFKIANINHDSTSKKAMKVRDALDKWLNENIFIEPQLDGLI